MGIKGEMEPLSVKRTSDRLTEVADVAWVRTAMFVPKQDGTNVTTGGSVRGRINTRSSQFSDSSLNFADTAIGGNRSINPRPQFTANADPVMDNLLAKRSSAGKTGLEANESFGMSQYYSEAIDSNAERIYMQFGVPVFNSLTSFYTGFFNLSMAKLAESGESNGIMVTVGKTVGVLVLWPVIAVLSVYRFMYKAYRAISDQPLTKYYYMKPTMPLYWSAVTVIVNAMAVNLGLVAPNEKDGKVDMTDLRGLLPELLRDDASGIDIRKAVGRYNMLANAHSEKISSLIENTKNGAEGDKAIRDYILTGSGIQRPDGTSIGDSISDYSNSEGGKLDLLKGAEAKTDATGGGGASTESIMVTSQINQAQQKTMVKDHMTGISDYLMNELQEGSAFMSLIVNYDGTYSESVSNSTKSSDLATAFNERSAASNSAKFNTAHGNFGDNPLANLAESIMGGIKDFASGITDVLGFSGINVLLGAGVIDMPEFWDRSQANMSATSYSIELRTPYGHRYSILQNILIPLAMLLAGAFPRTVGKGAFTSPFLCKLWHKGAARVELGMITDINITRGVGGIGYSVDGIPLGIDVSFTVTNLSKMTHIPISTNVSVLDAFGLGVLDEDTNFTDYMAVLTGVGLLDQFHITNRFKLRSLKSSARFDSWLDPMNFIQSGVDTMPGHLLSAIMKGAVIVD